MAIHIHIHDAAPKRKAKDATPEALKSELARLETRMNAFTTEAPLKDKVKVAARIKEIEAELKKTGDAEWSAKHMGNFRFEVTAPDGRKISVPRAGTSAEAIEKAKALKTKDSTFTGTESAWSKKVKDQYPGAQFRPRPIGKVVAKVGDKDVGTYDKEKGAGTIEDGVRDAQEEEYKGYKLSETKPEYWMAKKGFSNFGPAKSLQELKTRLDKHLASIAKGGGAP